MGPFVKIKLNGEGVVSVDPLTTDAVHALSACLEVHGYATRAADTGAYNCRQITGGTGYSLHAYGIAVDLNWITNPYGPTLHTDMPPKMVAAIKAIRTVNGKQVWRWGGDYAGNKDAMHYEIVAHPGDLATGIDPDTLPHAAPPEDDMTPEQEKKLDRALVLAERCHDALGLDGKTDAHGNIRGRVDALYLDMKLGAAGEDVDLDELVAAVKALPAATVAALKAAL